MEITDDILKIIFKLTTPEFESPNEYVGYWLNLRLVNKQFNRVLMQILPPEPTYIRDELPPPEIYNYIINVYLPKHDYRYCYICLAPQHNSVYNCDICRKNFCSKDFCYKYINEIRFQDEYVDDLICDGCLDWYKFVYKVTLTHVKTKSNEYLLANVGNVAD